MKLTVEIKGDFAKNVVASFVASALWASAANLYGVGASASRYGGRKGVNAGVPDSCW